MQTSSKEASIDKLSLAERIHRRAYELYVQRGNQSGSELDDWLQAEEEIRWAERERFAYGSIPRAPTRRAV
jgi:hypothetical protein